MSFPHISDKFSFERGFVRVLEGECFNIRINREGYLEKESTVRKYPNKAEY